MLGLVKSDSCIIVGIFNDLAAITTGTETNHLWKIINQVFLFNTRLASKIPLKLKRL